MTRTCTARACLRNCVWPVSKRGVWPCAAALGAVCVLALATHSELKPLPESLQPIGEIRKPRLMTRDGQPMTITYVNEWNVHDRVPLYEVSLLLQQAFILAEDQRYYSHHGVDWMARAARAVAERPGRAAGTWRQHHQRAGDPHASYTHAHPLVALARMHRGEEAGAALFKIRDP